MTDTKLFL